MRHQRSPSSGGERDGPRRHCSGLRSAPLDGRHTVRERRDVKPDHVQCRIAAWCFGPCLPCVPAARIDATLPATLLLEWCLDLAGGAPAGRLAAKAARFLIVPALPSSFSSYFRPVSLWMAQAQALALHRPASHALGWKTSCASVWCPRIAFFPVALYCEHEKVPLSTSLF